MLFDECERTVQDVGFRSSITAPIDDFFRHKHKAMVSATPIIPSDPRFEQQDFRMIVFKPDYDYKHTLHLIHTNNTPLALRKEIDKRIKAGDKVCIFFNAVECIGRLILTYDIKDRTNIYCGEDGVKTLKSEGFGNAISSLTPLAPINFFTSRFYSAVDIDVEPTDKVSVIMVSDYSLGRYSLIDPTTEAVQIVGRFRAGVEYICHIINTSHSPECVGVENVKERLNGGENVYNAISQITPSSFYESGALTQALERMDYSRFVESDGSRNHFMWDNATNEESVRSYYGQFSVIEEVYKYHFKVNVASSMHKYGSNSPLKKAEKKTTADDVLRVLTEYYIQHIQQEAEESITTMLETLRTFGAEYVKEKGYDFDKLKSTAKQKNSEEQFDSDEAFGYIYSHIKSGETISVSKANGIMANMVEALSIPYTKNITTSLLKRYFDFTYTRTNKERKIIVGKPTRADIYH